MSAGGGYCFITLHSVCMKSASVALVKSQVDGEWDSFWGKITKLFNVHPDIKAMQEQDTLALIPAVFIFYKPEVFTTRQNGMRKVYRWWGRGKHSQVQMLCCVLMQTVTPISPLPSISQPKKICVWYASLFSTTIHCDHLSKGKSIKSHLILPDQPAQQEFLSVKVKDFERCQEEKGGINKRMEVVWKERRQRQKRNADRQENRAGSTDCTVSTCNYEGFLGPDVKHVIV